MKSEACKRWSPTTGGKIDTFEVVSPSPWSSGGGNYMVELDDSIIITAGQKLKVWNVHTTMCLSTLPLPARAKCLLTLRRKPLSVLVGLENDGGVMELSWRMASLEKVKTWKEHNTYVKCLCELSDGTIVSGSKDIINRWNLDSGECVGRFTGFSSIVRVVRDMNDRKTIASLEDRAIRIWDLLTENCLRRLIVQNESPWGRYYPIPIGLVTLDGTLVSGYGDGSIRVWNSEGKCLRTLPQQSQCDINMNTFTIFELLESGSLVIGGLDAYLEVRDTWMT